MASNHSTNVSPGAGSPGDLEKVGRGLYSSRDFSGTGNTSLIEAAYQIPKGTVCLLSAPRSHNFTTQSPREVWMAIGHKAWARKVSSPSVRVVRMSGPVIHFGMKEYSISGAMFRRLPLDGLLPRDAQRPASDQRAARWRCHRIFHVRNTAPARETPRAWRDARPPRTAVPQSRRPFLVVTPPQTLDLPVTQRQHLGSIAQQQSLALHSAEHSHTPQLVAAHRCPFHCALLPEGAV
jgi:hypothetical protein